MAWFKRKEKKAEEVQAKSMPAPEVETKATVAKAEKSPAKAPAAKTAEKKPASKATSAPKATAEKADAEKKTVKSASKAPAKKPASTVAKRPSVTAAPGSAVAPHPFFKTTDEDIRLAFDQAIKDADYDILRHPGKAVGKYEFALEVDGYHFYLIANNGQMLFDSPSFTTLLGALGGVATFKKTVAEGNFEIKGDKYDRYRFILARKYYGENYTTREGCAKCVESVKNFASNAKIIRFTPDKEALRAYEQAKDCKRTPDDIDWKAVAKAEEQAQRMGKFEICREDATHYCFYLLANNGQILYSSRYYTSEAACRKGIESFKKAAYVGNFFVDRDKFGHYRYVLKNIGSAPNFLGESYDNKPQCEKIIDSVKKFIVSASIELEQTEE